jgi:hypothetical protein
MPNQVNRLHSDFADWFWKVAAIPYLPAGATDGLDWTVDRGRKVKLTRERRDYRTVSACVLYPTVVAPMKDQAKQMQ